MYCTVADVRRALAPVDAQGTTGTAAELPDDQLVDAINEADARINAYLSARYTIPMAPVSGEDPTEVAVVPVRQFSRNIAAYLATLTYKRNKDVPDNEPVRLRYSETISLLLDVRDGRANLPLPPVQGDGGEGDITVLNQYDGILFGPEEFQLSGPSRWWPDGFGIWPGGPGAW